MKAFVVTHYGPEGLKAADVPAPSVGHRDVLVDIRAASINPLDKMIRNGEFKSVGSDQGRTLLNERNRAASSTSFVSGVGLEQGQELGGCLL